AVELALDRLLFGIDFQINYLFDRRLSGITLLIRVDVLIRAPCLNPSFSPASFASAKRGDKRAHFCGCRRIPPDLP
ncbi:MAG: hypothetical protein ACREQ1_04350, partial [Woeseiaceae bacterium]